MVLLNENKIYFYPIDQSDWITTIVSVCIVIWCMYLAASSLDPKQLLINYKPKHYEGDSESTNTKNTNRVDGGFSPALTHKA